MSWSSDVATWIQSEHPTVPVEYERGAREFGETLLIHVSTTESSREEWLGGGGIRIGTVTVTVIGDRLSDTQPVADGLQDEMSGYSGDMENTTIVEMSFSSRGSDVLDDGSWADQQTYEVMISE